MPRATSLRLPYQLSFTSEGEATVAVVSGGEATVAVVNEGAVRIDIYNPKTDNTLYAGGGHMATITAYEGDKGYDLQFTASDENGDPLNLTGGTIKFKMALPTSSTLKVDGVCVLVSPTAGTFAYTMTAADLDTSGDYNAEVEITLDSGAKVITIGDIDVDVKKDLPIGG